MRIASILLILIFLISCSRERNCNDFKTGTFSFETLVEGEIVKTTFIRNDTLEIDFFQGKVDSSKIRWINNCEYIIQKINPINKSEEKAVHIKILETKKDFYIFEYGLVGAVKKLQGSAHKTN